MSFFFPQGSFFGIELAGKSLEAFQTAENVTSDNIANVNTPGASRQMVVFEQSPPASGPVSLATNGGALGDGVVVGQVQRVYNESYTDMFRGANSSQNFYQVESTTLQAVQSTLGDPNSGISVQYAKFQAAVNSLVSSSSTGSQTNLAQAVLTQAQSLANALNTAANSITTQKTQTMQQATTMVSSVNTILDQIATLNGQIRASTAAGDSPNTFEDERDNLIDNLSQFMSVQTAVQPNGSVLVSVNGQALVTDTVAYHLAPPTIGTAANGSPTFKIDFATQPPAAANAPGIPLGSGQLAAMQDLYNNKLIPYGQSLDQFASAVANETDRITQSGYDSNAAAGTSLFVPIVAGLPITASNIKIGINDPSQLPVSTLTTAAGSLVVPLNSANNQVDTATQLTNNTSLANPPAAPLAGSLTVTVNGVAQTFNYNTAAGANSDSINDFITSFNAAQMGVTASFNSTSQTIVFTRNPSNEGLALRAAQGANASSPTFTISDSNFTPAAAGPPPVPATPPNGYLLGVLGAAGLQGPTAAGVQQNATNALGINGNGVANSLVTMFSSNVGVPALQLTVPGPLNAGVPATIALPLNPSFTNLVQVGQVLTIDAQPTAVPPAPATNVTITGVSFNPVNGQESITFTPQQNYPLANFSIGSAQTQTLGQFYGGFITQVGLDAQTANSGTTTQTALATNLNQQRQSISGINIDEETQNLITYQNAYSAAAKTINVLNQTLQTVINSLGVGQ